jgi:hypothetical protein
MNAQVKYLAILILAIIVSATTSYAMTVSSTAIDLERLEEQVVERLSSKVTLPYEVSFFAGGNSLVTVYSKVSVQNLTIVYQYTCLDNGTEVTRGVEYGTFIPAWGAGAVIEAGAIPEALYKIPDDIIQASSKTKLNVNDNIVFDVGPVCEVLEVSGYT